MLHALAPSLWIADHPFSLYGVRIGNRMTVARLADGSLWLHSPIPMDDALKAEIDALGPVRHVVAPSLYHHLHAGAALQRWPDAALHVAPGLKAKRPDLPVHSELSDVVPEPWRRQIDQVLFAGMPGVNEVVFFHRPSKTLLATDLFFNVRAPAPWWTRTFLRMNDAWDTFATSAFFRRSVKDPAAARASVDRILTWDFDRVVVAHGQVLETGGRMAVAEALAKIG